MNICYVAVFVEDSGFLALECGSMMYVPTACPPISKDFSNTFLECSFIYAAPSEWNKLSECIRTSTFDSFRKSVKTMLFTQQYGC